MNQMDLYMQSIESDQSDTRELRCLATLQRVRSTDADLDRPADSKLRSAVEKSVEGDNTVYSAACRPSARHSSCLSDWTVADFLLLMIALLLFLNFLVR